MVNLAVSSARPRRYHGWLAGPTVNSLMVVSSGWSIANATTLAIRSGEIPNRSYTFAIPSAVSLWLIALSAWSRGCATKR